MLTQRAAAKWRSFARRALVFALFITAVSTRAGAATNPVEVIVVQGTVEVARGGQSVWDLASAQPSYRRLFPGDQIRTKERSRATIRLSDLTVVELGPNAHLELLRPEDRRPGFSLVRGLLHLFHRDKPGEYYFRTPTASPVIRGTEFTLAVAEDGATTLRLLEGEVALTNDFGALDLRSGDAALVQPARAPARIAALTAVNVIQWCLYYPAVLDPDELCLSAEEQTLLADSLAAYRQGDLLGALAKYPAARQPVSDHEKVYLAALLLAVGEVSGAEALLQSLSGTDERALRLATALRMLIAAVKFQPLPEQPAAKEALASTLLAESYYYQSLFELAAALASARSAVALAPDFGFAWARVAELELCFGRTSRALEAINHALQLAPRHAQAMAVKGFLLASQNRFTSALAQFDEAVATDGALGNAWLGRGLCRIYQRHTSEGVADLLVAAATEPNRALLRSYLGKGFAQIGDTARAVRELEYAEQLDPNDPTAWLYAALLNQQRNRINDAIRDLEQSEALNDNRELFRSRLMLDQDRAVRQANLAAIYQDAGLFDESVREAARAVTSDYANSSAHTFLANSYAGLRDPDFANLRYETATLSEYLIGSLLAPVGGSALSPYVAQQDYTRLFDQRGFGLSSGTEYRSTGDWWERGAQYGTFDRFDYSLDAYYQSLSGDRPNNDLLLRSLSVAARVQLSPQDTLFVQAVDTRFESGDTRQYYDPANASTQLRITESQSPNVFAGYHHEWGPGAHTLLLVSRLEDDFQLSVPSAFIPTLTTFFGNVNGQVFPPFSLFTNQQHATFTAWSAEAQQIQQTARNTFIVGARYQTGAQETQVQLDHDTSQTLGQTYPAGTESADTDLRRASVYAYDTYELCDWLWLVGGLSYDWLDYPKNIDQPPITDEQTQKSQVSPKAGVILTPLTNLVVRGDYTRSLGGLYFDNSVRLEPTQVAGFNHAFRSLIPESVAGLTAGAEFQTGNLELSWHSRSGTYLGLGLEWLNSDAERDVGVFIWPTIPARPITAANTPQDLEFVEQSLTADLNQLIGRDWSVGIRYRGSKASLDAQLTDVPADKVQQAHVVDEGVLHQLQLSARYSAPCGFFAEAQGLWFAQTSQQHYDLPGADTSTDDAFWQVNVFAGYRFARRRAEVLVGGLNLAAQNYRLNPINFHVEPPRQRTLLVQFKFNF